MSGSSFITLFVSVVTYAVKKESTKSSPKTTSTAASAQSCSAGEKAATIGSVTTSTSSVTKTTTSHSCLRSENGMMTYHLRFDHTIRPSSAPTAAFAASATVDRRRAAVDRRRDCRRAASDTGSR
jgi:hypothetical protein